MAIIYITVSAFTTELGYHIKIVVIRTRLVIRTELDHVDGVFVIIRVQVPDNQGILHIREVCRVGKPVDQGFGCSFTRQVTVALPIQHVGVARAG